MFLWRLSSWVDRFDPYWYSRLIGLKVVYIAVILFIANTFLQPPVATLIMMISGGGVLIIEMPAINDLKKKDTLYLAYVVLMCVSIGLFSSYVYLKGWFIVVVTAWAFILYSALKKKPELFALVSSVLMLSVMSLEGWNSGNWYVILNELLFILEFSLITFWAHKLFPNLYHLVWLSSTLRTLEGLEQMLQQAQPCTKSEHNALALGLLENNQQVLRHTMIAAKSLNLLRSKTYLREAVAINTWLAHYYYYLNDLLLNHATRASELAKLESDLRGLSSAIRERHALLSVPASALAAEECARLAEDTAPELQAHRQLYSKLVSAWNQLCVRDNT